MPAKNVSPVRGQIALVDPNTGAPSAYGLQVLQAITGLLNGSTNSKTNVTSTSIGGLTVHSGAGSPLNVVAANPGEMYVNTTGGSKTTLYVKETGTGTTGWVAK